MTSFPLVDSSPVDLVLSRLVGVKATGKRTWLARCPAHEDRNPSLSVSEGGDGRALVNCHAGCVYTAVLAAIELKSSDLFPAESGNSFPVVSQAAPRTLAMVKTYDYADEDGAVLFQVCRYEDAATGQKTFRQRRAIAPGEWAWGLGRTRLVPYRLPELLEAVACERQIFLAEGEKDVETMRELGYVATTNPMGAGKWRESYSESFRGAHVVILPDNDEPGRSHAEQVAASLTAVGATVRVLTLPGLPEKGDVSDWLAGGGTRAQLDELATAAEPWRHNARPLPAEPVSVEDFYAIMPAHAYMFVPSRELWPAASVNARIAPIAEGATTKKAAAWLDVHRPVEQLTWAPGEPIVVCDRLISDGGWIPRAGCSVFNLYRPPQVAHGHATFAGPWLEHLVRVYPAAAEHITQWLAHRVQRPGEKINHALVLGGNQGIGKDTILEPVKMAIGPWNFQEVAPAHLLGRFNGFVKSVILRVSEARDLGDMDRYAFYDHLKSYTASPPDVLRCDEKNLREYAVMNVCGVIITTNHKTDGIYLPADDRRHFVAWSECARDAFPANYWRDLYRWYAEGGTAHVAAYLATLDLAGFDPKAPPPKTAAFWDIVDANRAPEDAELADAIEQLGRPRATTLSAIAACAAGTFGDWLRDRKNSRQIPHRLEAAGYVPVRNDGATDGRWKIGGRNVVVYARHDLAVRDRLTAVTGLTTANR